MPPVNDNFANAINLASIGDIASVQVDGTLIGATADSPPDGGFGENVWYYVDLDAGWGPPNYWLFDLFLTAAPDDCYVSIYRDVDGTWANLDYLDGTLRFGSKVLDSNVYIWYHNEFSGGATFRIYIEVSVYPLGSPLGTFSFHCGVGQKYITVSAQSDINLSSPTASIVSGWVRDTQSSLPTDSVPMLGEFGWNDTFYIRGANLPATGMYAATIVARRSSGTYYYNHPITLWRNGLPCGRQNLGLTTDLGTTATTIRLTSTPNEPGRIRNSPPDVITIKSGDEYAVRLGRTFESGVIEYIEAESVTFERFAHWFRTWYTTPQSTGDLAIDQWPIPATSAPIALTGSHLPLGSTTVISDNIRIHSGWQIVCSDICVTEDNTVYIVQIERLSASYALVMRKWNGSSWSTVSDNVWGRGNPSTTYETARCSIDTDGTDVWISWFEDPPAPRANAEWDIRVRRYNAVSNTFDSIMTAKTLAGDSGVRQFYNGLRLRVAPDGKVWIGYTDSITTTHDIIYYDGSWHDTGLPAPTLPPGAIYYTVPFVPSQAIWQVDLCFRHASGPSNWPSAVFIATYNTTGQIFAELCYSEYNGSTWSTLLQVDTRSIWLSYLRESSSSTISWQQGQFLLDGGDGVYYVAALGSGSINPDGIFIAKLRSDASGWDIYNGGNVDAGWKSADESGFGYLTTIACADETGRIWVMGSGEANGNWWAPMFASPGQVGNGNYWLPAQSSDPSQVLFPTWQQDYSFEGEHNRIYYRNNNIYVWRLVQSSSYFKISGVWKYTPSEAFGPISVYDRVPLR